MKIAVVSDTHHRTKLIINKLKELNNLDKVIHLGDIVKDAYKIEDELDIEVLKVRGNCDFNAFDEEEEKIIHLNNRKILMTHGHKYNIKVDLNRLYYKSKEIEADIVLFGHTHMPYNEVLNNTLFFNPGSPTNPRSQEGKTYGIIQINKKIEASIFKF